METTESTSNKSAKAIAPKKTALIPQADLNLKDVSKEMCTKWADHPQLILIWTNQPEFVSIISHFETSLSIKKSMSGSRSPITKQMEDLDKEIDDSIEFIKDYLAEKYKGKKNAIPYYVHFGIIKTSNKYTLSTDHSGRKESLSQMVTAITTYGFENKDHGLAYWTDIKSRFDTLYDSAYSTDEAVADHTGKKNTYKKTIKKTLNAIIHLIKANYPDTYKAELRNWGFQKEKY